MPMCMSLCEVMCVCSGGMCVCSGGVAVCVLILQLALGVVNLFIWLSLAADELNCLMIEKLVEMFFKLAGCFLCFDSEEQTRGFQADELNTHLKL